MHAPPPDGTIGGALAACVHLFLLATPCRPLSLSGSLSLSLSLSHTHTHTHTYTHYLSHYLPLMCPSNLAPSMHWSDERIRATCRLGQRSSQNRPTCCSGRRRERFLQTMAQLPRVTSMTSRCAIFTSNSCIFPFAPRIHLFPRSPSRTPTPCLSPRSFLHKWRAGSDASHWRREPVNQQPPLQEDPIREAAGEDAQLFAGGKVRRRGRQSVADQGAQGVEVVALGPRASTEARLPVRGGAKEFDRVRATVQRDRARFQCQFPSPSFPQLQSPSPSDASSHLPPFPSFKALNPKP